jgi:hypothetical protein
MTEKREANIAHSPIYMAFCGAINFIMIDSIATIISERLDILEKNINIKKKVFGVAIECLQNLGKHAVKLSQFDKFSEYDPTSVSFFLENKDRGYHICTINFVPNDLIKSIEAKLMLIKTSSKSDIKLKYNYTLLNSGFCEKGGMGLGFLDLALRTDGKMDYEFKPFNTDYSLFYFKTEIEKKI